MRVVSTTLCYPHPARPTQGIFVWRRLREINRLVPVKVIAPVLWFPGRRGGNAGSECRDDQSAEWDRVPQVVRPRMFYLPGVLKRLDAAFYARAFRAGLAEEGRVLIDAHFEWPDGVGAWRVAKERQLPFVCTLRGKLVSQIRHPAKRRMIREMLLGADALIAVSRSLAELANEVAGRDLGVRVIPNGIDPALFHRTASPSANLPSAEARAACGWSNDAKYAVCVGHVQELKGFHNLVEAWPEVRRRIGDARLILVGGSVGEAAYERALRSRIERVCTDSGTCGTAVSAVETQAERPCHRPIVLAGRVPPERVATMLNAADLFVLASRSEGWCNAIAEALACGCPVVATDVGGNREIVGEPRLGRLVPPGDREALADGICRGLAAAWDREQIATIGGRRDWQQVARECVDVFEETLGRVERVGELRMQN
jgi:glycosyltransferase involved in cell wall biosynthesis